MPYIPNDEFDEFEEEPNDELASAGFRVIETTEAGPEAEDEVLVEEEVLVVDDEDEPEEEEKTEVLDGLKELEQMEKSYVDPPLTFDDEE